MEAAIENDGLRLVYQPRLSLRSGRIVGIETLMRWDHDLLGTFRAMEVVRLAEQCGLVRDLTRWLMYTACRQFVSWRNNDVVDTRARLAIDLSAQHAHEADVLSLVRSVLRDTLMPPACLQLELPETTVIVGPGRAHPVVTELRELGLRVAINDFGRKHSSLSYLVRTPVDSLKLDQRLITGLDTEAGSRPMARAIITLGAMLDMRVIAPCVQTDEQNRFLLANGCRIGQGSYYSPEMGAERVRSFACEPGLHHSLRSGRSPN